MPSEWFALSPPCLLININKLDDLCPLPSSPAPIRKIRIGGSRLLQIKGARSFRVKKGGSLSSIRRAGSLKSTKLSRQDSESENEEGLLSQTQSRDTVTDIGKTSPSHRSHMMCERPRINTLGFLFQEVLSVPVNPA